MGDNPILEHSKHQKGEKKEAAREMMTTNIHNDNGNKKHVTR